MNNIKIVIQNQINKIQKYETKNKIVLKDVEEKLMIFKENGNVGSNIVGENMEQMLHYYNMLN